MSLIVSEVYDALIEAGASEAKAKATAGAIPLAEQLATKEDIALLKEDIGNVRAEVAGVKANPTAFRLDTKQEIGSIKADLAAFEARFIQRLWLVSAIIVGLNVTLVKLLA